ncbi:UNVERIFIED_CONTAM: hypothetical protein Sradi_4551700 [Sesamum radiatum]|uniref:Uncharacterized protein n=1 Tax=Sesamum radiatum TaxID=300843 RepID=A0AAW2N9F1_SESRA
MEELLTIELIPGDPGKVIKIGSKMIEDVGDHVVNYLMRNKDIFAWTPRDLGYRPKCHHASPQPGPQYQADKVEKATLRI